MSKYEVKDDNYKTPDWLYNYLNDFHGFTFDPCPYNEDKITPETDGLLKEWGDVNFVNPPYSRGIKDLFVIKAYNESLKGKKSVILVPVVTSTKLFHEVIKPNANSIEFIKGRIRFEKLNKETNLFEPSKDVARHDSMIVVFEAKMERMGKL